MSLADRDPPPPSDRPAFDPLEQPAAELAAPLFAAYDPQAGERLGPYEIVREVGRGGMAAVYLARDPRHGRQVALKVLEARIAAFVGRQRFEREIQVAARLLHPHILPVFDSGESAGRLWYAMPYVAGETLRHRLARERQLPAAEAVRIAREVASALDYAHRAGVVHRDIKPGNILLADGQALVADFGIARALDAENASGPDSQEGLTETGVAMGTPAYMSPEQALGAEVDGRTDIYALGCVLYEMLAGEPPFTGPTVPAVLAKRLSEPVPSVRRHRAELPEQLDAVIGKALAKAPADRYATASELVAALDGSSLRDSSGSAGGERTPIRRLRFRLVAAVIGLVVGGAIAAVVLSHRRSRSPLDADLIAVAPFDVLDPRLAIWREGLVDYLSRNLDGAGALRTVPPSVAIHQWAGRADATSASVLGQRTGAKLVLVGQVVGAGPHATRLRATLIDAADRTTLAEFERADQPDRVDRLADSLTVDVLRELGRTRSNVQLRLSSVGTTSLSALKAFLQGEQSFRRAAWDSAVAHYGRAVALDSTFALAWWRMALAGNDVSDWHVTLMRWVNAGRFNHGLSPHDSLLVAADSLRAAFFDSLDPGYWSHLLREFSTLEEATRRYPDDPEAWYRLGEARYHFGQATGGTAQQTLATFDQAIALDSGFGPAYIHPIQLALESAGPEGAQPYIRGYLRSASQVAEGEGIRLVALLLGPGKTGAEVRQLSDTGSSSTLFGAALTLSGWADSDETALQLLRAMSLPDRRTRAGTDTSYLDDLLVNVLAYRGHLREARALMNNQFHQVFVEIAQLGVIPPDSADAVISRWFQSSDDRALRFGGEDVDRCRRTAGAIQWWAARGDTAKLWELGRRGMAEAVGGPNVYARSNAAGDVALSPVGLALARRDVVQASRLMLAIPDSLCPNFLPFHLLKVHLLVQAGRDREAAALFDRTPLYNSEDRSATAVLALLERGRVAERLGDRQKAIECYQRVLDLWRHADPELHPFLDEARSGLQRLTTESAR
jgi:serine/threonine-protein kinase